MCSASNDHIKAKVLKSCRKSNGPRQLFRLLIFRDCQFFKADAADRIKPEHYTTILTDTE